MDLVNEIETAAASTANKLTVVYANLLEANLGLDKITRDEYPVLVVLPPIVNDVKGTSGLWESVVDFNGFILFKDFDAKTSEYKTKEAEQRFVQPSRKIGRQFFNKLSQSQIINKATRGIVAVTYNPTYGEFDAHLHGVVVRCNIPIIEGTTCTLPVELP